MQEDKCEMEAFFRKARLTVIIAYCLFMYFLFNSVKQERVKLDKSNSSYVLEDCVVE